MTKRQDLCLQRRARSEQSDQRQPNQAANISHQPRASPDSTALTSRIEFPTMTGLVHCDNAIRMVAKERLPSMRAAPPRHILGDAGLADLDAELEKLSMDSRRSPQRVGDAHLADQPANFQQYRWSAAAVPRFPAQIRSETGTQRMTVSGFECRLFPVA